MQKSLRLILLSGSLTLFFSCQWAKTDTINIGIAKNRAANSILGRAYFEGSADKTFDVGQSFSLLPGVKIDNYHLGAFSI